MTEIVAHFTNGNVPLVAPGTVPTIRIRRIDTQALVVTDSAMTEIGDGNFSFTFSPAVTLEYSIRADGDPAAAGQVTAGERFVFGALSGTAEDQLVSIASGVDLVQYLGSIWIDTANGAAGTVVGVNGLPTNPVDSLADAVTLATATGFRAFSIRKTAGGPLTLTQSFDDWNFIGIGEGVNIALNAQDVDGSSFSTIELSGIMNGRIVARDCGLDGVTELEGTFFRCDIENSMAMPVAGGAIAHFEECSSHVAGPAATPKLSVAGTLPNDYHFRSYSGGIEIENSDHAGTVGSLDIVAGQVVLGATNTAGAVAVRGVTDLTDTSGASFTVTRTAALNLPAIADDVLEELISDHNAVVGSLAQIINLILSDTSFFIPDQISSLVKEIGETVRTKLFFATAAITTGSRHVPKNAISHMEVQVRLPNDPFPGSIYHVLFNYEVGDAATASPRTSNTQFAAPTDGTFTSTEFPT